MRPPFKTLKHKFDLVGVEVGVRRGAHALVLLQNLSIDRLYLVDPWEDYAREDGSKITGLARDEKTARKSLARYANNLVWFKQTSAEAVKRIADRSLDFVYIDGDHHYKHVLHDVTAWTPKVKRFGMVAGHDYTSREGVRQAVNEYCSKNKINLIRSEKGSHWWFIK